MDQWLVRYQNICGETIGYTVEAEDNVEAWDKAEKLFNAEDPDKTKGYELEGVYHYD